MSKLKTIFYLLRFFGYRWLLFRLVYTLKLRSGYFKRVLPCSSWNDHPLKCFLTNVNLADAKACYQYRQTSAPKFFFSPEDRKDFIPFFQEFDKDANTPVAISDKLKNGIFRYFSKHEFKIGFPPDWFFNPLTGKHAPSNLHWSEIKDFEFGDIKVIWEPSRFDFVYALVRSFWRTGCEEYAETFWLLIDHWRANNLPQQGPNWKCGQEISFRVMAWIFGLYGFLNASKTTPERVAGLTQMIAVSGMRIQANLNYAVSQRNNHGISEATGLWTVGLLFPELRHAQKWRALGREVLERSGSELIYNDGSFAQHSVCYHRLILHDYLWAIRLGDLNNQPLSIELRKKVKKAGDFLYQIQDESSGKVPDYGQNDGALILPLNNCDYQDFRPVIQAVHYLSTSFRCYKYGEWDEDLLWLFGAAALQSDVKTRLHTDLHAETGGYYTLRSETGFAFIRSATFRDRPGQADMLHLDLWQKGQNIATDAGTYSYNAPDPWNNPFAHSAYHNTVTVDSSDQMERAGKFLWLPWIKSRKTFNARSVNGMLTYWEGGHNGYHRLKPPVSHRRGVLRISDDTWLVLDKMTGKAMRNYRLHWLLSHAPFKWDKDERRLSLKTPAGDYQINIGTLSGFGEYKIVCGDKHSPHGWRSPYYSCREPALAASMSLCTENELFWTLFAENSYHLEIDNGIIKIRGKKCHYDIVLQMKNMEQSPLITHVFTDNPLEDHLEMV